MAESNLILIQLRYADNALGSFPWKEETEEISCNLHLAHNLYNFPSIPIVTSAYTDQEKPSRDPIQL